PGRELWRSCVCSKPRSAGGRLATGHGGGKRPWHRDAENACLDVSLAGGPKEHRAYGATNGRRAQAAYIAVLRTQKNSQAAPAAGEGFESVKLPKVKAQNVREDANPRMKSRLST